MSDAWAALRDGVHRVNRAPALLFGLWCVVFVAAIQVALTRSQGNLRTGFDQLVWLAAGWIVDVVAQPTDAFLESKLRAGWTVAAILGLSWTALVLWVFVTGGVIDRYARDRATRANGFFAASGVFFFRFVRLTALQLLVDAALFVAIPQVAVAWAALTAWSLVIEYAKVRAVVEDRRSAIGAIGASVGFLRRNLLAAAALFGADYIVFGAVTLALRAGGDAVTDPTKGLPAWAWALWTAIGVGVVLWIRLLFWASETALFQLKLAHAGYVARPEPVWPDSPAAESITGSG